ncbi:MAG: ATPase, T2SS/T4P/T4SS family [Oscillochloridaceae bacterium umkhey_bin13]
MHPHATLNPSAAHGFVATDQATTEELRMLVRSGRLRDCWDLPPEQAFRQLGLDNERSTAAWARVDWYGPLEIWRDPEHEVSDILYNGPSDEPFYVVQRGAMVCTGVTAHPAWLTWTQRQLLLRGGVIQPGDEVLPAMAQGVADRLRFATVGPPVARLGPGLAVRLLPERWRTLDDLVQASTITREAADLLLAALSSGASVLVAGPTGSGKTTLTAALTQAIGRRMRLVMIEDGGELPRSPNSLHLEAPAEADGFTRAVSFALRQKPAYIIVGEVRGGEAIAMLQAAATGHPGVGTIHAGSIQGALHNLERMAMIGLASATGGGQAAAQVVRGLITSEAVSLIVIMIGQSPRGRRTVLSIEEVLRQGAQGQSGDYFPTNPLFSYDPLADRLSHVGNVNATWGLGRF